MEEGSSSPVEGEGARVHMQTVNTAGAAALGHIRGGSTLYPHAHAGDLVSFELYLMNFPLLWVYSFKLMHHAGGSCVCMYALVV